MAEFKCVHPGCDWSGKSQSGLTLHAKKHSGDDPLAAARAKLGDAAPRPGGAFKADRPLVAAPSGIPSIDYAIGIGGVPRGTLIEVFGPPASGKTFTALTFSAHAQANGGRVGFVDAERALQPTFCKLVPGLDLELMEYSQPRGGEQALNITKEFIASGLFDVWTIDSVHACTPRALIDKPIGDATMAELAKLMSIGCQVLEHVVSETNTVAIFINHVKARPGVQYGRDWSKPGGSAFDYYCSVQLHVTVAESYYNKENRRIGHRVKVKVHKSKVAAPHATAEYDLYYAEGTVKGKESRPSRDVVPGVDIASNWFSVLKEDGRIRYAGNRYIDDATGEPLGSEEEVLTILRDEDSSLIKDAREIVYPSAYAAPQAA